MRIMKKDLDQEVIDAVDLVLNFKKSFTVDNGYLSFNGRDFYMKENKDINARRLTDYSYVSSFKEHRYETNDMFSNSFQSVLSDTPIEKFRSALVQPKNTVVFRAASRIILTKIIGKYLYVITSDGVLYKYDGSTESTMYQVDLAKMIYENFEISFTGASISDICADGDVLYIATHKNGVFYFNEENRHIELVVLEPNISHIEILGDSLLCFSDILNIFSLETKARTEKISFFKNEKIMKILDTGERLFVVCRSLGTFASDKVLHMLELDEAGSVILSDNKVARNPKLNSYDVEWANADTEHVYVSGIKNQHAFMWEYSIKDPLEFREIIIDRFQSDNVLSVEKYYENFILYTKEHVVIVKDHEIHNNYAVPSVIEEVLYVDGKYLLRTKDAITKIEPVQYKPSNTTALTIDSLKDSNELEININGLCKPSFSSGTGDPIKPLFVITHKGSIFVKLNIPADASNVILTLSEIQDNIDSVIIKKNRVFYR